MDLILPRLIDIVDILLIAGVIYLFLNLTKQTNYWYFLFGLIAVVILYFIATIFQLEMISSIFRSLKDYWLLTILIVFQPEIRKFFTRSGFTKIWESNGSNKSKDFYFELLDSVTALASQKIGAIIVIENKRKLNDFIAGGVHIDAVVSLPILTNIFSPQSKLHDGAVIIRKDRIVAAKVILPLSSDDSLKATNGTRHLAGLGISEVTDAFTIIVSEESGKISYAFNSEIFRNISYEELLQKMKDAVE
ncbi:MAG: diadenylate cyclase CdaA [Candidatus Cloacimonetes bacterium]|nr:diadenylate cyclase CdaA [Candidatus Cloacimonadota bacterium]